MTLQALYRISDIVASINLYIANLLRLVRSLVELNLSGDKKALPNKSAGRRLRGRSIRFDPIAIGSSRFDPFATGEF